MQAFKEASLAFVGMDWVGKNSQDEQTNAAAQEVFAKISQATKDMLAQAKNPAREPQEEDLAASQTAGGYVVPTQDAVAQEYTEESQILDVVVSGGMAASHLALEDEQAVCWDMAEQLEDDLEGASEEISTQLRNAINLLKSARTPTEIEHAKRIAKAAKAAAENNGSEAGVDDEPTLSDKINMLNKMYEAAKKSNEAALEYIRTMDDIRKENPGLFTKEGWDAHDAWAEKASKRPEEWEARRKAQEEEMKAAKTDEERQAIADKYLKLEAEATERAKKEDEEYQEQLDKEAKRIAKSGSEKDKLDMQKAQDEFKKYKIESKDRDEVSEKVKAEFAKMDAREAEKNKIDAKLKEVDVAFTQNTHFLETQANALSFTPAGQAAQKKGQDAADDLLGDLGAPASKKDEEVAQSKANAAKGEHVSEDLLGDLGAPVLAGKGTKDTKAQARMS